MAQQNYRERAESQSRWGTSNQAAFELRDWMISEGMIIVAKPGEDTDLVSMVACIRNEEEFCGVEVGTSLPLAQVEQLQQKVREIAEKNGIDFRVLDDRTRQIPSKGLSNSFPWGGLGLRNLTGRLSVISFEDNKPKK